MRPTATKFALYNKLDSMRWFSHRRSLSCHLWVATQWHRLLLLAAYGLDTAHALLCIVNGNDSAVFRFLSLPGDLGLWHMTLTFELGRNFCTTYLTANFNHPMFSRSELIVQTNKQTNKRRWNIHLASLRYAGG